METTRLIKKYPNRRLYDTELSLYITLEELKAYVLQFIPFKVVDVKTEEDVTRASLIQILLELEGGQTPFFTQVTLEHMVRLYGSADHLSIKRFLEASLDWLTTQQGGFRAENKVMGQEIFNTFAKVTADNLTFWQELWKNSEKSMDKSSGV